MYRSHLCVRALCKQAIQNFRGLCSAESKEIRLNKFLSEVGVCSRRAADKLIESGRVVVNNETALLGTKVTVFSSPITEETAAAITSSRSMSTVHISSSDVIVVDGKVIGEKVKGNIYLALNKPVGIVCTTDTKREKNNIIDFLNYPSKERLFHIGRLDKPSRGLILLTNDGDIVNKILRAENNHEKEYIVEVHKPLTANMLTGMSRGVPLFDNTITTNKCSVVQLNSTTFKITLTQGLNRQIRRMCQHFNYEVVSLERIRIMNVQLDALPVGKYRELTPEEVTDLVG
jgi:23S rRNA pseudouridine2604 synthase